MPHRHSDAVQPIVCSLMQQAIHSFLVGCVRFVWDMVWVCSIWAKENKQKWWELLSSGFLMHKKHFHFFLWLLLLSWITQNSLLHEAPSNDFVFGRLLFCWFFFLLLCLHSTTLHERKESFIQLLLSSLWYSLRNYCCHFSVFPFLWPNIDGWNCKKKRNLQKALRIAKITFITFFLCIARVN